MRFPMEGIGTQNSGGRNTVELYLLFCTLIQKKLKPGPLKIKSPLTDKSPNIAYVALLCRKSSEDKIN